MANAWNIRTKEEKANVITHFAGVIFALAASWILIRNGFYTGRTAGFAMSVFTLGIFILYLSSTLYHWALPGKLKRTLRYFDHANIYLLIAASYTPIWLCIVKGTTGWIAFGVLWGLAIIGTIGKIIALGKYPKLSLAVYLIMGWSALFVIQPVWNGMSTSELLWILAEGICYTVGTYFFAHDERPFYHSIWHLFVLGGTAAHFVAMWLILK